MRNPAPACCTPAGAPARRSRLPLWAGLLALPFALLAAAIRYRGARYLANCNPGMVAGGLFPVSKSHSYALWAKAGLNVPVTVRVARGGGALPADFVASAPTGEGEPRIVAKPDAGMRGRGLRVFASGEDAGRFAARVKEDYLFQHYVRGDEFSVFYERNPAGGSSAIVALVERQPDCVRVKDAEFVEHPVGEAASLLALLDAASQAHGGLHHGRFDLKAPSIRALRSARDVTLLEFNGAASAPQEIYDARYGAIAVVRRTFATVTRAFRTGRALVRQGHAPPAWRDLAQRLFLSARR